MSRTPRSKTPPAPPRRRLFGVEVSPKGLEAQLETLLRRAPDGGGPRLLVTMNLDHVVQLRRHPGFRAAYGRAAVVTLDGAPVWLYARLRGVGAPRCTGADLFAALEARLEPRAHRPFFVLSGPIAAERLAARLQGRGFDREALGFAVPPFGFDADPMARRSLVDAVRAHGATHLVMGLGAPKSELFVDAERARLPDLHALCVGAAPDFVAGVRRRAPQILRRMGLEWAWRVREEPRRLARRYLLDSWGVIPAILEDLALRDPAPPEAAGRRGGGADPWSAANGARADQAPRRGARRSGPGRAAPEAFRDS